VPVYAWISLAVFVCLLVPASVVALVASIRLFRSLRTAAPGLEFGFQRLANGTEVLNARTERVAAGLARAEASAKALSASRAQLATLLWALEDARRIVRAVLAVAAPRK
jgi:hypothetical protein